jgi:hypothetical protein
MIHPRDVLCLLAFFQKQHYKEKSDVQSMKREIIDGLMRQ